MPGGTGTGGARLRLLAAALPSYWRIAWWGLVSPRTREREPLVVHQAVVIGDRAPAGAESARTPRVLLAVRSELRGWELPGGGARPGESGEAALIREVREETGLDVAVEALVAEYVRTGFRPHTAYVYRCRVTGGALRPSRETPRVRWFPTDAIPGTLFPWFAGPLRDGIAGGDGVCRRREHQGPAAVLAGMRIDLRMRLSGDEAV